MSIETQSPPPAGAYPHGAVEQPPAPKGTSGLAVAGFVLAILVAPVGFILSIVGLIQAGRGGRKGKGLAAAGIVISLLLMIGSGTLIFALGKKVSTLTDPGCLTGKTAIMDNAGSIDSSDVDKAKAGLQATVDGLSAATAKATHDNVRATLTALHDDYATLLNDVNSGTAPDAALQAKMTADAKALDALCTIGS